MTMRTPDLSFVDQVRTDIAGLLKQARDLDPHDPKVEAFVRVLIDKSKLPNNKAIVFQHVPPHACLPRRAHGDLRDCASG